MIDESRVRAYLGEGSGFDVTDLLSIAVTIIDREIGVNVVPESARDRATLMLCSELSLAKKNPGGIVSYSGIDQLSRLANDPMRRVRPILSPWCVWL